VLARLSGRRPGVALVLAGQPEVILVHARLSRTLLDLIGAPARTRLAAVSQLLEDGAALASAQAGGEVDEESSAVARGAPAQRRAAVGQVLATWRELARDLALTAHGATAELRQAELLDDLVAAARGVAPGDLTAFVARLDGSLAALDGYANPDLLLDTLLLAWPRSAAAESTTTAAA
jgi:hypothetical protein